jgi:hypothetical protein
LAVAVLVEREVLAALQDRLVQTQFSTQLLLVAAVAAAGLLLEQMGLMAALVAQHLVLVPLALEIPLRHHRAKETMAA